MDCSRDSVPSTQTHPRMPNDPPTTAPWLRTYMRHERVRRTAPPEFVGLELNSQRLAILEIVIAIVLLASTIATVWYFAAVTP